MAAGMKAERQRRIVHLLRENDVTSQAALAELLREHGERVTQATLSRDLDELGAVKTRRANGELVYDVPEEPPANTEHLHKMLVEFLVAVEPTANLVVLRTPPGGAQPVARALDTAGVEGVLATVAGDDTILVVCREGARGATVAERIEHIAAGPREGAR